MSLPWRRLAGFGALQLFAAISPILALPVVVRVVGTEGWVGLSIGYGVGAAGAVVSNYAWSVTGPARVAACGDTEAASVYHESLVARALASAASVLVVLVVATVLAPEGHRFLSAVMAAAVMSWGLSPSWYYVGRGLPVGILRYETLPRLVGTLVSIPVVKITRLPVLYPLLVLAFSLAGAGVASYVILRHHNRRAAPPGFWHRMRTNGAIVSAAVIGAGYTSLAIPIAQLARPPLIEVADLAASARLRSMGQMGTAALSTGFQGWVAEPKEAAPRLKRMQQALLMTTLSGVGTAAAFVVLAGLFAGFIFGSSAHVGWWLTVVTAATCIPYAVSSSLAFHVLTPLGLTKTIVWSRIAATCVGAPLLVLFVKLWGATGGAIAAFLAETTVAAWQGGVARGALRQLSALAHRPGGSTTS